MEPFLLHSLLFIWIPRSDELLMNSSSHGHQVQRMALRPSMPILVRDGDAFVQLIPEETMRLTVGIDHSDAAEVRP